MTHAEGLCQASIDENVALQLGADDDSSSNTMMNSHFCLLNFCGRPGGHERVWGPHSKEKRFHNQHQTAARIQVFFILFNHILYIYILYVCILYIYILPSERRD
jgi:hypothetical protein